MKKIIFSTLIFIGAFCLVSFTKAEETTSTIPEIIPETPSSTTVITSSTEFNLDNQSTIVDPTPDPPVIIQAHLTLRYNDQVIYNQDTPLSEVIYHDQINNLDYPLNGSSTVFSLLVKADQDSDNFSISNAQFNPGRNSFYIKCLNLLDAGEQCDNWQYVVNGTYPQVGMDSKKLSGGENVYIYFGERFKLQTEKTEFYETDTVTTSLDEYEYNSNLWNPANGQEIIVTEPIKSDYSNWPPITITSSSAVNGKAYFNLSTTGTYFITLPDSYWPGINITITSSPEIITTSSTTSTTGTGTNNNSGDNNSGSNSSSTPQIQNILMSDTQINEAVAKILNYIKSNQDENGGIITGYDKDNKPIIDGPVTDWVIMSFGANNQYADEIKNKGESLLDYEKKYNLDDSSDMNSCASYPRHILALLAAGVSKDDVAIQGLKNKIYTNCYKNNLYSFNGTPNGINDDIFALLGLLAIDTPTDETIIVDILKTIKKDQIGDGAFTWDGWAGADMTGAAMNALKYAENKGAIIDHKIYTDAKNYLRTNQHEDGGWGWGCEEPVATCIKSDVINTTWVLMGINALGEGQNEWLTASGTNPWEFLVNKLDNKNYYEAYGGPDWFGMKHAVPALLGKSWPIILPAKVQNFSSGGGLTYLNTSVPEQLNTTTPEMTTTTLATTTIDITTTTLEVSTTTINTVTTTLNTTTTEPAIIVPTDNGLTALYQGPSTTQNKLPKNLNTLTILQSASQPELGTKAITNSTTFYPVSTSTQPFDSTKTVFGISLTAASGLGLYLAWRLLQTLI